MSWFNNPTKTALREAAELRYALNKNLTYARDTLQPKDRGAIEQLIEALDGAIQNKDTAAIAKYKKDSLKLAHRVFPANPWDGFRENIEVFVVAVVVALAVRSFFLQPFKIPTGSMQPTLNGVQITTLQTELPSWPQRVFEMVAMGRTYGTFSTYQGGLITSIHGSSITPWFEYTDLYIGDRSIRIWANQQAVMRDLGLYPGKAIPAGQTAHFRIDTGDQVLVNKVIYNFRKPARGEVFVFKTTGIRYIEERSGGREGSQYYIKRCVGVPGDSLSIEPPYLKVDGSTVHSYAFDRVYSQRDGYHGYGILPGQNYLQTPQESYSVKPDTYWAMGDNSYQSSDSRFWGPVVRSNLVGTGFVVYWPFTSHWGWIR
jgi:signal peptidase I